MTAPPLPPLPTPGQFIIEGRTRSGRAFRPSDWAERLCGVMSQFRPPGARHNQAHLIYSPYALPRVINGVKCVVIDERLRDLEPRAWQFVHDFATDNELMTLDACILPDHPA